jgi:hypothetical protein
MGGRERAGAAPGEERALTVVGSRVFYYKLCLAPSRRVLEPHIRREIAYCTNQREVRSLMS